LSNFVASVYDKVDKNTTIWFVLIQTPNGKIIDNRPFNLREDAEAYADKINANQIVKPVQNQKKN
jgi:hypothetical protein